MAETDIDPNMPEPLQRLAELSPKTNDADISKAIEALGETAEWYLRRTAVLQQRVTDALDSLDEWDKAFDTDDDQRALELLADLRRILDPHGTHGTADEAF